MIGDTLEEVNPHKPSVEDREHMLRPRHFIIYLLQLRRYVLLQKPIFGF